MRLIATISLIIAFSHSGSCLVLSGAYYKVFPIQNADYKCVNIVEFRSDSTFRIGRMWGSSTAITWKETGRLICSNGNYLYVEIIENKGPLDTAHYGMNVKHRSGIDTLYAVWKELEDQNSFRADRIAVPIHLNCQNLVSSYFIEKYKARKVKKGFVYIHSWIYNGTYLHTEKSGANLKEFLQKKLQN